MSLPGETYVKPAARPGFYPEPRGHVSPDYPQQQDTLRAGQEQQQPGGERYPPDRLARPDGTGPRVAEKYERYESNGETTLADTIADVHTFSGRPDAIVLTARLFGALVTLTDRLNQETSEILVPVNTTVRTYLSREKVQARNAIAGSNAVLNAVGMWAVPMESH
jgi:hypothetical protein